MLDSSITSLFYNKKWECIFMYFIAGLPKVQGKDSIYVVVDRLTKFSHLFAVNSTISTSEVAALFFKDVFKLHGFPKTIISDWANKITSSFWRALF